MKITKIDKKDIPQIRPMWEELNKHHATDDLKSIKKLLELLGLMRKPNQVIKPYPVWDGDQGLEPKRAIYFDVSEMNPNRFFLNEPFLHILSAEPVA